MKRRAIVLLTAATCLLGGCNQPAVMLKAPAVQSSENTVRDWNDVAHTIATGLTARGLLADPLLHIPASLPNPVFIRVRAPDSTFLREVAAALENEVLQTGGVVARTPDGATVVNLDVDVVAWGPRDKPPGLLGLTAIGLVLAPSTVIALTPTMNAEAVWYATVLTNDRTVLALREPVYVRSDDIPLYAKNVSLGALASWTSIAPLRVRTVRYDP
jgi:hypothetical protein